MSGMHWHDDWRARAPRRDFASRVVAELSREEGGDARARRSRRAWANRRRSPMAVVGLAALLLSGVALGSLAASARMNQVDTQLKSGGLEDSSPEPWRHREPPRIRISAPPVPMEAEKEKPARSVRRPAARILSPPEREPLPSRIHYPACHCSSGAVVCSCVD